MTLGLGRAAVVKIPVNDDYEMDAEALAMAIETDHRAGRCPVAVVATIGTTSSTSVDPVAVIADIAAREGLWLHVDAAYAVLSRSSPSVARRSRLGSGRLDRREPAQVAVHPARRLAAADAPDGPAARRVQPRARVPAHARRDLPVLDYNEYQPQLGRRMRALKLWMQLRWFGVEGLRRRIDAHLELAQRFAGWVDEDPDWQRLAPVPFSTVCFRYRPASVTGREDEGDVPDLLDDLNMRLMDAVNRTGDVFLSHTRLRNRFAIRVAIGNLRTTERHVEGAWALLRAEAARLAAEAPMGEAFTTRGSDA